MTRRKVHCAGPGCGRVVAVRSNDPCDLQPMNHRDPFTPSAVCVGTLLDGSPIDQAGEHDEQPKTRTPT